MKIERNNVYFVRPGKESVCSSYEEFIAYLKKMNTARSELRKNIPCIRIMTIRGGRPSEYYIGTLTTENIRAAESYIKGQGYTSEIKNFLMNNFNAHNTCSSCFSMEDLSEMPETTPPDTSEFIAWKKKADLVYKKIINEFKSQPMERQIISLDIIRENGKSYMKFSVPSIITKIYEAQAKETRKSEAWKGLDFFYIPELLANERYNALLRSNKLFDKFGSSFTTDGLMNIAWLRTKQGEGQFEIPDNISFAELTSLSKNVHQFIKDYFDEYLRDFRITMKAEIVLQS